MKSVRMMSLATFALFCAAAFSDPALAVTTTFFDSSQTATKISGVTSDTIDSKGYRFTYSLDKLFDGGTGVVTGRQELYKFPFEINAPIGLHAQAVTTTVPGSPAHVTISRVDGSVFDLNALSFRLLANTLGAGANLEITPVLNGNEGQIVSLFASGGYNSTFSYNATLPPLVDYDTYDLSLYVDFALLGITLTDATIEPPPDPGRTPVPEPETSAMMLLGLGIFAFFVCRRKQGSRGGTALLPF